MEYVIPQAYICLKEGKENKNSNHSDTYTTVMKKQQHEYVSNEGPTLHHNHTELTN